MPSPWHASQRPPLTLNENRLAEKPCILASCVCANRLRISVNTPVYVAGLERGVLPMGDWSISTTLSRCSKPKISLCLPTGFFAPFSSLARCLYKISLTSEDLPDPDTPVTAINLPKGKCTSMFFRLFSAALRTTSSLPLPSLRVSGTRIFRLPLKYCPVTDSAQAFTSSTVPAHTTLPPCTPAPGPMSTI